MPATEYIAMLEKELTALRKQVCLLSGSASCRASFVMYPIPQEAWHSKVAPGVLMIYPLHSGLPKALPEPEQQ